MSPKPLPVIPKPAITVIGQHFTPPQMMDVVTAQRLIDEAQERAQILEGAINSATPQLRHLYWLMITGQVEDAKQAAVGLLAPQIVALESAQEAARRVGK